MSYYHETRSRAEELTARYTGARVNAAVMLAGLGVETSVVSCVPAHEVDFIAEKENKLINQVRAPFGEAPVPPPPESPPAPELVEQTPPFLNPEVATEQESSIDLRAEEPEDGLPEGAGEPVATPPYAAESPALKYQLPPRSTRDEPVRREEELRERNTVV